MRDALFKCASFSVVLKQRESDTGSTSGWWCVRVCVCERGNGGGGLGATHEARLASCLNWLYDRLAPILSFFTFKWDILPSNSVASCLCVLGYYECNRLLLRYLQFKYHLIPIYTRLTSLFKHIHASPDEKESS